MREEEAVVVEEERGMFAMLRVVSVLGSDTRILPVLLQCDLPSYRKDEVGGSPERKRRRERKREEADQEQTTGTRYLILFLHSTWKVIAPWRNLRVFPAASIIFPFHALVSLGCSLPMPYSPTCIEFLRLAMVILVCKPGHHFKPTELS